MACTCQRCGKKYRVDIIVDDTLWERIKPEGKSDGLLCGECISRAVEGLGEYGSFRLQPAK